MSCLDLLGPARDRKVKSAAPADIMEGGLNMCEVGQNDLERVIPDSFEVKIPLAMLKRVEQEVLGPCPECSRIVKESKGMIACVGWHENTCGFGFNRWDIWEMFPGAERDLMESLLLNGGLFDDDSGCTGIVCNLNLFRAGNGGWCIKAIREVDTKCYPPRCEDVCEDPVCLKPQRTYTAYSVKSR